MGRVRRPGTASNAAGCQAGRLRLEILQGALFALIIAVSPLASAGIVATGDVAPNPSSGSVAGQISVGISTVGQLDVNAGSTLTANSIGVANGVASTGTVNIVGTGVGNPPTVLNVTGPSGPGNLQNPLGVGNWGNGTMTVSNGAIVNGAITGGVPNPNCIPSLCNNFIGNAAGSTALLTLTGAGTTANLAGGFIAGGGAVFTTAPGGGGFNFGTPGGTTNATVQVLNGATLNTYNSSVSQGPGGQVPTGNEHTIANVLIDGANSVWNITRNPVTNTQASLNLANHANATATIDVTGGGQLVVTGSSTGNAANTPGINMGAGTSMINVNTGGALIVAGDSGFINVGINGGTATLNITDGGQVYGGGTNGLLFMNVGRSSGGLGTLNVEDRKSVV